MYTQLSNQTMSQPTINSAQCQRRRRDFCEADTYDIPFPSQQSTHPKFFTNKLEYQYWCNCFLPIFTSLADWQNYFTYPRSSGSANRALIGELKATGKHDPSSFLTVICPTSYAWQTALWMHAGHNYGVLRKPELRHPWKQNGVGLTRASSFFYV